MKIEMYRIFFEIQKKHWWFVTRKNIVLDFVDRYLPEGNQVKVLDIGCGSGLMLNALAKVGQTFGMDMSDEAISFSKEIFDGRVEKGALPDQVPYQEEFFDLITALDVIEHIDDDVGSISAIRALLVPGGKCIFTVPAYMFLWSAHDEMNQHKRRYTLPELNEKLVQAGFTVEKISYYNTLLFPAVFLVRMLNNVLQREGAPDTDMPGSAMNYVLKKIFGIEKYLLRYLNLPFGVSVLAVVRK
jgi:2-polyprenyl-3-methyl-5-hydroxy-6-metoxy-1,4-benzoquinol methylase